MNRLLRSRTAPIGAVFVTLAAMITASATALPAQAAPPAGSSSSKSNLGKHDRELLAQARAQGDKTVMLLIAAARGQNASVAKALTSLGADVRAREDGVDYLRVRVAIDKVQQAANVAGVESADVDEIIPLDDPAPGGSVSPTPQTPQSAATPRDNAYMPIADTGADAFMDANPTYDGRGTTIAIVDTGVDLDGDLHRACRGGLPHRSVQRARQAARR